MKHNIVRIEIETVKPGTVVRGKMINVFLKPPPRYCWFPRLPVRTVYDTGLVRFDGGGHFLRFDALGLEADGITAGDVEFLMTTVGADMLFRNDLQMLVGRAESSPEVFRDRPVWVGMALYEVERDASVKFTKWLDLEAI
jgi:hypothetical protein